VAAILLRPCGQRGKGSAKTPTAIPVSRARRRWPTL